MTKFYIVIESRNLDLDLEANSLTNMNHTKFYSIESAQIEKSRKDEDLNCDCHILEVVIDVKKV